ncbi:hypothetical protein D3C86_928570 [compost metagenome]
MRSLCLVRGHVFVLGAFRLSLFEWRIFQGAAQIDVTEFVIGAWYCLNASYRSIACGVVSTAHGKLEAFMKLRILAFASLFLVACKGPFIVVIPGHQADPSTDRKQPSLEATPTRLPTPKPSPKPIPQAGTYPGLMPNLEFSGKRISPHSGGFEIIDADSPYCDLAMIGPQATNSIYQSRRPDLVIQLLSDTPTYGKLGTLILCNGNFLVDGIQVGSELTFVPGEDANSHPSFAAVLYRSFSA